MLGVIATLALCIYALYFYALVKLIPITLTLPGIAGLILTLGVAADANIVVFERVKEEVRAGRSVGTAIVTGYRKGLTAIIDANIVTFLVAFILFIIATAGVQGFAFTLGLGVIVSLFTAVLATQAILYSLRGTRLIRSKAALGAGEQQHQVPHRLHGQGEVVLLLVGLHPARLRAGDVRQGHQLRHRLRRRHADHRRAGEAGDGRPGARHARAARASPTRRSRRCRTPSWARTSSRSRPRSSARTASTRRPTRLESRVRRGRRAQDVESIGPSFGQTVARSAVYAIIASLLIISIYIALRFEWKFAVPVLIALMHDILIVAGVYALVGREVTTSTVAALLTILGYSLYDTIIVFDRIRENIPRMPSAAFSQIVNRSLSEVIVRSIATSFCTLLPVLALMLFGGETLHDFAFALLIGIASGTYSSIFIATPVLQHWKEREPGFRARHARILERARHRPALRHRGAGRPGRRHAQGARRRRSVSAPPGQEVSATEFQEMVRDLGVEERRSRQRQPAATGARAARPAGAAHAPAPTAATTPPRRRRRRRRRQRRRTTTDSKDRKPRNKRHGRPR